MKSNTKRRRNVEVKNPLNYTLVGKHTKLRDLPRVCRPLDRLQKGDHRKASVNPRFTTCSIKSYTYQLSFLGLFKLRNLIMLLFSTTFLTLSCLQFSNPSPSIFGFPLFFLLFLTICVTFYTVNVLSIGIGLFQQKKQVLSRHYYYASRPFTKGVLNHQ